VVFNVLSIYVSSWIDLGKQPKPSYQYTRLMLFIAVICFLYSKICKHWIEKRINYVFFRTRGHYSNPLHLVHLLADCLFRL